MTRADFRVTLLGTGVQIPSPRSKLAAYTHFVAIGNAQHAPPTVDDIVAETRQTYDGSSPTPAASRSTW